MIYPVIMAGGKGERFWPKSRLKTPKQLLCIAGDKTMIQDTVDRLNSISSPDKIIVVTNSVQAGEIKKQLPQINPSKVISEPCGRNTTPCIALAAAFISNETGNDDAVMVVLPADHVIKDKDSFSMVINDMVNRAKTENSLFTIGINPTHPATGYGYINVGDKIESGTSTEFFKAVEFAEKPDSDRAEQFLKSGNYLWNSGIFVWRISVFLSALRNFMPDLYNEYLNIKNAISDGSYNELINKIYPMLPNISVDYGIMEKSPNVVVAKSRFDWDDVGAWDAVAKHFIPDNNGNVVKGKFEGIDTKGCIIFSDKKLVASIGVENLIVVVTDDAVLICDKAKAQDVKQILKNLSADQNNDIYF